MDELSPEARALIEAAEADIRAIEADGNARANELEAEMRARVQSIREQAAGRVRERRGQLLVALKPLQLAAMRADDLDAAMAIAIAFARWRRR
jgi:hypothetical protein